MINKYIVIGFISFYIAITLLVGMMASVKRQNIEMYFLAGRRLGPVMLAFSFSATAMSGLLFFGFSGMFFESGLQNLWLLISSGIVGILLCYYLVSKKIRLYSERTGALTVIELLKNRYGDSERYLARITAMIIIVSTVLYVSGQLIAMAKLMDIFIGLPYETSIIIFASVIVTYTVMGGFKAVCWTDVFQGISMVLACLLVGSVVWRINSGFSQLWLNMTIINQSDSQFYISPFATPSNILLGVTLFLGDGIMSWIGQPTLMTRYMSLRKIGDFGQAKKLSVLFQMILFAGVVLASFHMRTQYFEASMLPMGEDMETVFIQFFLTYMNPLLGGVVLGGIIAAIISTADSLIILASSIWANDIYGSKNQHATPEKLIWVSKITTLLIGLIVVLISFNIHTVLLVAWTGWTMLGIVGVPLIVGMYWKRATLRGAICAEIAGVATLILWVAFDLTGKLSIFYAFPAGVVSYLSIFLVSWFDKSPPDYIQQEIADLNRNYEYESKARI